MKLIKEFLSNKKIKIEILVFSILIITSILFSILNINNLILLCLSICANLFLIMFFQLIKKILKLEFSKTEKNIIIISIIIIYSFYFISVLTRNFIYYWDYSCYYNIQITLEENFNIGLISGLKNFLSTTWSGEYGNFLSFFPEVIFNFTNKTINAYLLSSVLIFIPYIIISFSYLIKIINRLFKIKNNNFLLMLFTLMIFPIFHSSFIFGQPDLFGLTFAFLLIALTLEYNFKRIDLPRLITLLIITFLLFITRRWYIYFIISFYICYILGILIKNRKEKHLLKIIKNGFIYTITSLLFFVITMLSFIKNVLINDFSNSYNFYLDGGFINEIVNQLNHLGIIITLIMLIGIIYGIEKKKYRLFTILSLLNYIIIISLFTRIQNMGIHHSLLLIPSYISYLYLFTIFIDNKRYLYTITIIIYSLNFITGLTNYESKLLTNIPLRTPAQNDYNEIREVSNYLETNLNKENKAYMITHNSMYNPDKFRNFYAPDNKIKDYLPYGSAILGTHSFPIELFESKYIITTYPYEPISLDEKYNKVFNKLIEKETFELIKTFNMKNGINILIYKRVKEVSLEEVNMYLEEIQEETSNYDELYKNVIEYYIINNNIK